MIGLQASAGVGQPPGKPVGIVASSLFATITTAASCGAINAMHDSFTPIGGKRPAIPSALSVQDRGR